jgi:hypothetical protein
MNRGDIMFEFIKADPTTDPTIDEIRFTKEESGENNDKKPVYAIEIFPSNQTHHFTIRGVIHALVRTLSAGGSPTELEVDFTVKDKIRAVGNISEAMLSFNENKEETMLFSESLLLAIDNHKGIQVILKNSKAFYAGVSSTIEANEPSSPSSLQGTFKKFKPKPREESKESDETVSNAKNTFKASQPKIK